MIYILTGEIRSGKTTALQHWCNSRQDVDGLLCPDTDTGKRCFMKIQSGDEFELEVETKNETADIIEIGNYTFLKSAFQKANAYLLSLTSKTTHRYLIVDELGKLELHNNGLHDAAKVLISNYMLDEHQHVILVVRDYLLDAVVAHYQISDYSLLKKADLELLE